MLLSKIDTEIALLIQAKFPIISIVSYEEQRVLHHLDLIRDHIIDQRVRPLIYEKEELEREIEMLERKLEEEKNETEKGKQEKELESKKNEKVVLDENIELIEDSNQIIVWSYTEGMIHFSVDSEDESENEDATKDSISPIVNPKNVGAKKLKNPIEAMKLIGNPGEDLDELIEKYDWDTGIFVFRDLHPWLNRNDRMGRYNHLLVRHLRDNVQLFKQGEEPRCIILISPLSVVPEELSKDFQLIEYPLPDKSELEEQILEKEDDIKEYYSQLNDLEEEDRELLAYALKGLTLEEADKVLDKSFARNRYDQDQSSVSIIEENNLSSVLEEKRQIIKKEGTLDYFETDLDLEQVGGLEELKHWLELRQDSFMGETEIEFGPHKIKLPPPKGLLMIGIPGCGKSLVAKAIAKTWQVPLLRMDVGRIFGGIVGQSEENMRKAIRVAESVAPAIIWIDEIEKAFPKTSGSNDSGVALRVLNTFLSWMQEKKEMVFVVATGNDISALPIELTRKGRFDEIFFVGLPNKEARTQILTIHTKKNGISLDHEDLESLAEFTRYFTGSEIEQVINNSLYRLEPSPKLSKEASSEAIREAIKDVIKTIIPQARQFNKEGTSLLKPIVDKATTMGVNASQNFEELPKLEKGEDPRTQRGTLDRAKKKKQKRKKLNK